MAEVGVFVLTSDGQSLWADLAVCDSVLLSHRALKARIE